MGGTVVGSVAGVVIAIFVIVYLVVILGSLAMMVIAIVDIARRPDWQWKIAGQERILWLLLVILINILAIPSLIYWFNVRPKLIAVEEAAARGAYGAGHMTYVGCGAGSPRSRARTRWRRPVGNLIHRAMGSSDGGTGPGGPSRRGARRWP